MEINEVTINKKKSQLEKKTTTEGVEQRSIEVEGAKERITNNLAKHPRRRCYGDVAKDAQKYDIKIPEKYAKETADAVLKGDGDSVSARFAEKTYRRLGDGEKAEKAREIRERRQNYEAANRVITSMLK